MTFNRWPNPTFIIQNLFISLCFYLFMKFICIENRPLCYNFVYKYYCSLIIHGSISAMHKYQISKLKFQMSKHFGDIKKLQFYHLFYLFYVYINKKWTRYKPSYLPHSRSSSVALTNLKVKTKM